MRSDTKHVTAVRVNTIKPPLPTLWFDTSVAIDLTKMKEGESIEPTRKQRLARFSNVLGKKVREAKLLCVEGDQREELQGERLEAEIRAILTQVSMGIRFRHRVGIHFNHLCTAMEAYAQGRDSYDIPFTSYFHSDPIAELWQNLSSKYLVHVHTELSPDLLSRFRTNKAGLQQKLESLREELHGSKITYEEQLRLERKARADVMINSIRDFYDALPTNGLKGFENVEEYHGLQCALRLISKNENLNFGDLYRFMTSAQCQALPVEDISSRLFADLMINPRRVGSGDSIDVDLLSISIPVCHYVVADKDMVDRINRRKIALNYNCEVYSTKTLDVLCQKLEAL